MGRPGGSSKFSLKFQQQQWRRRRLNLKVSEREREIKISEMQLDLLLYLSRELYFRFAIYFCGGVGGSLRHYKQE